jgi:hypothetical protein
MFGGLPSGDRAPIWPTGSGNLAWTFEENDGYEANEADEQDEIAICGILCQRSDAQLRAIAQAFPAHHKKSLSAMYVLVPPSCEACCCKQGTVARSSPCEPDEVVYLAAKSSGGARGSLIQSKLTKKDPIRVLWPYA